MKLKHGTELPFRSLRGFCVGRGGVVPWILLVGSWAARPATLSAGAPGVRADLALEIRSPALGLVSTNDASSFTSDSEQNSGMESSSSMVSSLPPGITLRTVEAIERGLSYLARRQDRDGSWSNELGYGAYPVAMTALAGLALLMDGNTPTQGRYAPQVDRATTFLLRSQGSNGLFAQGQYDPRPMHGHGFATLYLSQVYGMIEDSARARQVHEVLTRAVALTSQSQSDLGGWLYTPDARRDEGSVTVTQVQALRSCRNVGVFVPKSVIDLAMEYLLKSQNSDGGIRYTASQSQGPSRPAITAAAVACWYNAGEYDSPHAARALRFCKEELPANRPFRGHDYYAHLYLAQALFVSADPDWEEYFRQRREYLIGLQRTDGSWYGDGVGDIYGTAVALIILQLPYQQLPIMQR